jgi:uncharacterized lipoprotein YmbA
MKRALPFALLTSFACSILPRPEQTRFYVLSVVPHTVDPPAAARPRVGLGPITLPTYLDRPQLVTRMRSSELFLSETERWAEPLEDGFARVLREDLEGVLGPHSVVLHPWPVDAPPALALSVDVERFERLAGQTVALWARWTLRDETTGRVLATGERWFTEGPKDESTEAAVLALSRTIGALAVELGHAIDERAPIGSAE